MKASRPSFSPLRGVVQGRLPNGLRYFLKPDRTHPLVSVQGWVSIGSLDESESQAGISHIVEHMVFKGTASHRGADIARWVEEDGGSINAETSREYTHYYIDLPSDGAARAVSLLGELLWKARFEADEWHKECPVILEEIRRRNDDPESLLWDLLGESLYQDPRLRRAVIGSPETVAAQTRDSLLHFYQSSYTAARSLITVAGDFDPHVMKEWIAEAFGEMPPGTRPSRGPVTDSKYVPRQLKFQRPVKQVYAAIGFPTPAADHPDHEPLDVLANILGEGRGSRLVDLLRERKKIVWAINASNITQEGPGMFAIFLDCEQNRLPAAKKAVQQILQDMLKHPPTAKELKRAKNMLQNSWLQSFETAHQQASTIGLYALEDHLERLEHYLPRILAVTPAMLRDVIRRYLGGLQLSSAAILAA